MKQTMIVLLLMSVISITMMGCGTYRLAFNGDGSVNISPVKQEDTATTEIKEIQSVYGISRVGATEVMNPERDYLILVNDDNPYDFNGKYHHDLQADLVYLPNAVDGDIIAVEKAAYLAFTQLQRDLKSEEIEVALYDAYRTAEDQQFLINLYAEGSNPNITKAHEPGYSEHHTGLLLDVVLWYSEDGEEYTWYSASDERLRTIPEFRTLYEKIADYGFIERYPSDKVAITGRDAKEYEIRFVGLPETAHEIMDSNLCLEEYLAKTN